MRLRGDERAQSVQVGAIILFGFLIVGLATYQATVVPSQNQQAEFEQSQTVRGDLTELRNAFQTTGTTGESRPVEVGLGTRFEPRTLFVNPPPAAGTIRTRTASGSPNASITFVNATVTSSVGGEADDYWVDTAPDGSRNFSTKLLVYEADYREYTSAADNVSVQFGHVAAGYGGGRAVNVTTRPGIAENDRLTLVLVQGNVSENGVDTVTVEPSAVSSISRRETVRGVVNVTLPTTLPPSTVKGLFRRVDNNTAVNVTAGAGPRPNTVNVTLNTTGTGRQLRLGVAAVGVGDRTPGVGEGYVDVEARENVSVGETGTVVVEVRDEYGNPMSGVPLNVSVTSGSVTPSVTTGEDGTARIAYAPAAAGDAVINVSSDPNVSVGDAGFDASTAENASVRVSVASTPSGNATGAWPVEWGDPDALTDNDDVSLVNCDNESCTVDPSDGSSVTLRVGTGGETNGAPVRFSVNDTSVATVSPTNTTNTSGVAETELTPIANGTVEVVAESGGGSDVIEVTIRNLSGGPAELGVVFRDGGQLKTVDRNGGSVTTYATDTPQVIGPASTDLDGDGAIEIPFVANGDLKTVDENDSSVTRDTSSDIATSGRIGVGDLDGDGDPAIFYVRDGNPYKIEPAGDESSPTELRMQSGGPDGASPVDASAIAGVTNYDGGEAELVFLDGVKLRRGTFTSGGTGDLTNLQTVVTGVKPESVGSPGDFDRDGTEEVPYRTNNANFVRFADGTGEDGQFITVEDEGKPKPGSLATFDVDDRGEPAVVFVNNAGTDLSFVYLGKPPQEVKSNGSSVDADETTGAAAIEAPDGRVYDPHTADATDRRTTGSTTADRRTASERTDRARPTSGQDGSLTGRRVDGEELPPAERVPTTRHASNSGSTGR